MAHGFTFARVKICPGYGLHKELENALELFHEMREEGARPSEKNPRGRATFCASMVQSAAVCFNRPSTCTAVYGSVT